MEIYRLMKAPFHRLQRDELRARKLLRTYLDEPGKGIGDEIEVRTFTLSTIVPVEVKQEVDTTVLTSCTNDQEELFASFANETWQQMLLCVEDSKQRLALRQDSVDVGNGKPLKCCTVHVNARPCLDQCTVR